jgi:hypothetical protein
VLTEVIVASLLLLVGLLGTAGLLRLATYEMRVTARAESARWAVSSLADSLVAGLVGDEGERSEPWGVLRWAPAGGGVTVDALEPGARADGGDRTLARIWIAREQPGVAP